MNSMPNYWIFVVVDHKVGNRFLWAERVLERRLRKRFWALNPKTSHFGDLQEGDKALFYAQGRYPRGFAGSATLASKPHPLKPEQMEELRGEPSQFFTHAVELSQDERFIHPKTIRELGDRISFKGVMVRKEPYFRGSIKKLSREQYDMIISLCTSGTT